MDKTPEQIAEEQRLADDKRIAEQQAQYEADQAAERQAEAERQRAAEAAPAPRPKTSDAAPAPRPKASEAKRTPKAREGDADKDPIGDGKQDAVKQAEREGTISTSGQARVAGVQAANTVPQHQPSDVAQHMPGLNPSAIETDTDNLTKVAGAYLGGDAARDMPHPRPPAYGSPEYDVWMFENREQAIQQRKAEKS